MPDTSQVNTDNFQGDIRTGYDRSTLWDLKLDTFKRMTDVLDRPGNPTYNLEQSPTDKPSPYANLPKGFTYEDAMISDDPKLRELGYNHLQQSSNSQPFMSLGLGREIRTPYDQASKYINKKWGYDAQMGDVEDFYYDKTWGRMSTVGRIWRTPFKMLARIVPQIAFKVGEGLGYVGSMITSIGSENYWANVADNGFSKWLEEGEQRFKDVIVPVYKQAGFNEKGFFSKLVDSAFWTDEVADAVAFMGSAMIPSLGLSKLGTLSNAAKLAQGIGKGEQAFNAFGRAFSATNRFGKIASKVGMGSPAQLTAWTFNTAMEASVEASGVFKESMRNMKELRNQGIGEYANMSDEDMRERAGSLASNTVGGNFLVLALSNAWENTLFFKGAKKVPIAQEFEKAAEYIAPSATMGAQSKALENLVKKNPFATPLSRTRTYGAKAFQGFVAEGLWEENAQLVIQRMNTIEKDGDYMYDGKGNFGSFFKSLIQQTGAAFSGKDKEAAESIGLGALIGIGTGVGLSKLSNERQKLIKQIQLGVAYGNSAKDQLFASNDIYAKDDKGNIIYDKNVPRVDPQKLNAKKQALEVLFGTSTLSSGDKFNDKTIEFDSLRALSNYVRSMLHIGVDNIGERLTNLSKENAELFGLDPNNISKKVGKYVQFAKLFEENSKNVSDLRQNRISSLTPKEQDEFGKAAKSKIYRWNTDGAILSQYTEEEQSTLLDSLNRTRSLDNNSLDQYTTEQLNKLLYQKHFNDVMIKSDMFNEMSDLEKKYHLDKAKELDKNIEEFKKNNDLTNSEQLSNGYYFPLKPDGSRVKMDASESMSLQKIANYQNEIEKNNYFTGLLSDPDNWYSVLKQLDTTPATQAATEAATQAVNTIEKSPFANYKEREAGDFSKVSRLVAKLVAGEQATSKDELQTQQNYSELINDLIPLYEKALENNRKELMTSKLQILQRLRDAVVKSIQEKREKIKQIAETVSPTSDIMVELQLSLEDGNTLNINKLKQVIEKTQARIFKIQNEIDKLEEDMKAYDDRIETWETEIEDSNIPSLKKELADLKEQKILLDLEIGDVKGILARISKLITDLIKIAKRLFPSFSVKRYDKIFGPENPYGAANFDEYVYPSDETGSKTDRGTETAVAYIEIKLKQAERDELKAKLKQLETQSKELDDKVQKWEKMIQDIEKNTLKDIEAQYLAITREVGKAPIIAPLEQSAADSFAPNFVGAVSVSINSDPPSEKNISDGPDYIRPLETKFFTSTFSDPRKAPFSKTELAHFELLDLLSNANRAAEAKAKLGKGKLKVLAVTRHNVEQLGLKDTINSTEGNLWEYKKDDIDLAGIALVHVIEEGGKVYFIDKELNRIGEVSSIDKKNKKNIVYSLLRGNRFKNGENEKDYDENGAYSIKWDADQKKKALAAGQALRQKIFTKSENFDIAKPNTLFPFMITKGVANKFENADNSPVKNPITQTLLTEDQINAATVVITTEKGKGKFTLNGQQIDLPIGRAFIKTTSVSDQLHYADNNMITGELADTILATLSKMSEEYIKLLEEALAKDLRGRKLSQLDNTEKTKLLVRFNSMKIKNRFGIDYIKYLNGVIYFDTLKAKEIPHPNKVYLSGSKIYFGNQDSIDISTPEDFLTSQKARKFLMSINHNVKYESDTKKASQPFVEYYLDGMELKSREWKTYNHYLLSEKLPDGKVRTFIPVTTAIKTAEQHKLEKDPLFPPLPYKSQAVILDVPFAEGLQKNVVATNTKQQKAAPSNKKEERRAAMDKIEAFLTGAAPSSAIVSDDADEAVKDDENEPKKTKKAAKGKKIGTREESLNALDEAFGPVSTLGEITPEEQAEIDKLDETDITTFTAEDEPFDEGFGEAPFRIITTAGPFKTETDLDEVIAYVKKILPQFPVERLKQAIQTMDGREAFGQFTGSIIKIWEGAEEGSLYHEAFEGVVNRLLKDYEWRAIYNEFKSRSGTYVDRETGKSLNYKDATAQQAKEQMAEEFRAFKLTGQLPTQKNTRTFFQMILDFIRKYILMRPTIEGIFKQIDEGKFADRAPKAFNRFFSNYSIIPRNLPVTDERYYDFLQGFTSLMFHDIFQSYDSLTALDELGEIDETLYDRVRDKVDALYKINSKKIADGTAFRTNTPNALLNKKNKLNQEEFKKGMEDWEKIKGSWGDFVRGHKLQLRKLRIKFNEEFNITEEEEGMKNMNDYTGSAYKTSQKNSASVSIRFLVGTLLKSRVVGVDLSSNQIFPKSIRTDSSVYLPELENYDDMMLKVLDKLNSLNRLELIEEKLKDAAGITSLQSAPAEEQVEVARNMNSEQAALSLLYMRLFASKLGVSEEAELNLRTKFLNYVSKQNPTPWIYTIYDGEGQLIKSTSRPFYENFNKTVQSALIHNIMDIFTVSRAGGIKTYTSRIEEGDKLKISDFLSSETSTGKSKMYNFLKFLGLEEVITVDFLRKLELEKPEDFRKLVDHLFTMRTALVGHKFTGNSINLKSVNLFKYTRVLSEMLEELQPQSEKSMSFSNGDNESVQLYVPPSFISRAMGEMNNSKTFEELIAPDNFPYLGQAFSSDSIILARMFERVKGEYGQVIGGKRTGFRLEMGYVEGIKMNEKFTKAVKMQEHQRLGLEFTMNLMGKYFSLPADSEQEWIFDFGEFVNFSNNVLGDNKMMNEIFIPKLRSEIQTAIEFNNNLVNLNVVKNGFKVGKSLRFFANILSPKLVTKIHNEIAKETVPAEDIINKNIKAIQGDISTYLTQKVQETLDNLVDQRVVSTYKEGENKLYHMNMPVEIREKFGENFTESQIKNVVAYAVTNSYIANMEQFKLFFGDIAQYTDWDKRAKSFFSPIEQSYYDDSGVFNNWMNENKNFAESAEGKILIPVNDIFHTSFKNHLTARTVDDITTVNPELVNLLNQMQISFASKFEDSNEVDGQSIGTLQAIRQLMYKAGWRWTKKNEAFFQYDTALARKELSAAGKYTYSSEALREIDNKILENNPPIEGISPIKTSMPSVRPDGTIDFIKHSIYPISYQLAKGTELLDVYIDMLNRGDDILNFKGAHKIGLTLDNQGDITSFYKTESFVDGDGNIVKSINPYEKTDLVEVGTPQFQLSFRTIGIQVETQSSDKGTSFGTQMSKDILINMMPNGIPTDFRDANPREEGMTDASYEQYIYDKWTSLTSEERDQSTDYRLVKDNIRALENMKQKNVMNTFDSLGVGYSVNELGKIEYFAHDLKKLQTFILEQMLTLDIDENTIEGLKLKEDLSSFINNSEALPSYETVSNIIWSIADKSVNHMKVNGAPYIQVSSVFFNKGTRNAAYKDDKGIWHRVDNIQDYQRLQKEGKKLVLTSSELKFYTLTEDGKTINAMEVYLPHIYKTKINKKREGMGLPALSGEELMTELNKDKRLLEGVGFRIPTQAKSSMEFFIIKGFMHESFGKAIVVPSDITTKAGSDFDVDKLSTYLNNWKLGKKGLPYYEEIKDDTNSTLKERFIAFIKTKEEYGKIYHDLKESDAYKTSQQTIQQNNEAVTEQKDMIGVFKNDEERIFAEGLDIFRHLPISMKQQYWTRNREQNTMGMEGVEKSLDFLKYTKDWIIQFESDTAFGQRKALSLEYTQKNEEGRLDKHTEVVNPEEAVPFLEQMVMNYEQFLEQVGLTREMIQEYVDYKEAKFAANKDIMEHFRFSIAKLIAAKYGYPSYEKFGELPIHLQNSIGSVQNAYFESSRNILKQGNRFDQLLSPNNMNNIIDGRNIVYDAFGLEKRRANPTDYLDINYLVKKRQAFAKGKYDIGIFAIGMTNYANSQIAMIGAGEGISDRQDYNEIMELNEGDISLPFDEAIVIDVEGTQFLPLGNEKDIDGFLIMDNLSGYITGAVDVAKEPAIVEMGMHTELASTYLLLSRARVGREKIALYLQQPIIRQYLKELIFLKNPEFGFSHFDSQTQLRKGLLEIYAKGGDPSSESFERINLSKEELINMIKKGEKMKKGEGTWTAAEKRRQYLIFVNFLKMRMFADDLTKNYRASNHDTSKIRSSWSLVMKDLIAEDLRKGNSILSVSDGETRNGIDAFREDTFVQTTIDLLNTFNTVFSDINLFALQKENPKAALLQIAKNLYNDRFYISDETFITIMREYSASMVDTLLNNYTTTKAGYTVASYIDTFFKVGSKNNIYTQFEKVKKMIPIEKNFFLSSLRIAFDDNLGVYTIGLQKTLGFDKTLSQNLIINGWRTLFTSPHEEVRKFAEALAMSSIIQFGVKAQRVTLTPIIPNEVFSQYSTAALSQIDTADFSTFEEEVIRANSYKKEFIPAVEPRAMEFMDDDGKLETVWANRSKDERDNNKAPKATGKVFVRTLTDEEKKAKLKDYHNKPVFFWQGRVEEEEEPKRAPNKYIVVKMVRPEYVTVEWDAVNKRWNNKAKKEVFDMSKKKDFSYLYFQLYKLVGKDGNTPIIYKKTKIKKGEYAGKMSLSYLYKPINSAGYYNFNEMAVLSKDDKGNIIGDTSSLQIHLPVEEVTDDIIYKISQSVKEVSYIFPEHIQNSQGIITDMPDLGIQAKSKEAEIISIDMLPQNIIKIASGTKTTTIRTTKQSRAIAIPVGATRVRKIGGDLYNVTNKGYLTVEEAGGVQAILKSEGLDAVEALKFQQTKDWIAGKGRLYVYDIQPIIKKDDGNLPPITPTC